MCALVWRSESDAGYLPPLPSTLRQRALTELAVQDYRLVMVVPAFYMGARDLNSDHYGEIVSTLLTEPFPRW